MKGVLFMLLAVFSAGNVLSQVEPAEIKDHVIIKFLPMGMFDIDNTFQFGVEIPLPNRRFTVQQEAGYGNSKFSMWYNEPGQRPDKYTFKTRTQLRFYFYEGGWGRSYVAGEYLYKRVVNKEIQWVGQDCTTNGTCGFFENKEVRFGRFVNAGHIKAGWQFYFSNRMTLDVYTGFGLRSRKGRILTENAGNARIHDTWLWLNNGFNDAGTSYGEVIPSLAAGFQIGFALGKFKTPEND